MSVYVDQIRKWPTPIRCFKGGSCHMVADSLSELHEMAANIGLRRAWFQLGRTPHYDLTPRRRAAAVAAGAIELTGHEYADKFLRVPAR